MAINQIAKIGLSSLQVIYYFENLFILTIVLWVNWKVFIDLRIDDFTTS
ncbi:protein of unknown function [Xenorhabdus doucetiae]|uniref:Uncharacterized protein n=1 Tax=Xenorhabdus doucetiae TaxID=351671 RepID=A0A068QW13_9GAMM|nr:protein of unknown function [Xenorhabdus doucetiae]